MGGEYLPARGEQGPEKDIERRRGLQGGRQVGLLVQQWLRDLVQVLRGAGRASEVLGREVRKDLNGDLMRATFVQGHSEEEGY